MDFKKFESTNDEPDSSAWVPPNDRDLTLRAKLASGWCCRSKQYETLVQKSETINENEQKMIAEVLERAQKSDTIEQNRVNKMFEKLNHMKRNARGNGQQTCILCNEYLGLFRMQAHRCVQCHKFVCPKCSVDTLKDDIVVWLCKICSETREVEKKTGQWFYEDKIKHGAKS